MTEKAWENRLRRRATQRGFRLHRVRTRQPGTPDYGTYYITDSDGATIYGDGLGGYPDLEQIEAWLYAPPPGNSIGDDMPTRPGLADLSEAEFQRKVIGAATALKWRTMHVRKAMTSQHVTPTSIPGWPDLVLWRERIIYRELKRDTGQLRPEQQNVLDSLSAAGADTAVWRPSDWDIILETLR